MKKTMLAFIFAMVCTGLFAQQKGEILHMPPMEFKEEIMEQEVQLIDVRTPEEYAAGHIKGSKNINYKSNDFLMEIDKLDRTKPIYIYCRSGNRSSNAAKELSQLGFEKIINLDGGYILWQELLKK